MEVGNEFSIGHIGFSVLRDAQWETVVSQVHFGVKRLT